MPEINNVLAEFLVDQLPSTMLEALQALTSLNYPIYDQKSLRLQLEEAHAGGQERDGEQEAAARVLIDHVSNTFEPVDFGLDTVQSALEKFAARRPRLDFSPVIPWPEGWDRDRWDIDVDEPHIDIPVRCDFGDDACGRAAEQLWHEYEEYLRRRGFEPLQSDCDSYRDAAALCRVEALPRAERCGYEARLGYIRCLVQGGDRPQCIRSARRAYRQCQLATGRFIDPRPNPSTDPFPGRGRW